MRCGKGASVLVLFAAAVHATACQNGCDPATLQRAAAFVDAHRGCMTDADCGTVPDFCGNVPGGSCGRIPMNRAAAASSEWKSLSYELADCSPEACVVCDEATSALRPKCVTGTCSLP